tara:strand:+ start:163 stop:912 length:750 start_codon:yes stop_codon:yes gene_type:complete
MYALAKAHGVNLSQDVDHDLAWVFGTGTAIHDHWQNEYLTTLGDVFQGWWTDGSSSELSERMTIKGPRREGPLLHEWTARPGPGWRYVELEFRDSDLRLTGHCDGVLVWPDGETEILELKTISEKGFSYVNGRVGHHPRAAHILQVHAYMMFTGLERARIVYIRKDLNNKMKDCLHEHLIERDERIVEIVVELLERCREVADVDLEALTPIERLAWPLTWPRLEDCPDSSAYRAISCAMKGRCFGEDGS